MQTAGSRYESNGEELTKPIDLLGLTPDTDVDVLLNQLIRQESLLSEKRKPQLEKLVNKLIDKLEENADQSFYLFKILRAHILPLTNCAFNKSGDRFITGSYDRTVRSRHSCGAFALPRRVAPCTPLRSRAPLPACSKACALTLAFSGARTVQGMEYEYGRGAADAGGPQERGLRHRVQQPLR